MTQPNPQDLAAAVGRLSGTLAALGQQVGQLRRDTDVTARRLDASGADQLAARFEQLAATVTAALDAASPQGPAAPRWDTLDPGAYRAQLASLRAWVNGWLIPEYCAGGTWALAPCWDQHRPVLWDLGTLHAYWRHTYARDRPDLARALEFYDRWLPHTLARVADMTRGCVPVHQPGR